MTIVEFVRVFLHDAPVGVVVTNADLTRPGPTILYANPAFGQLTGRDPNDLVGQSPRFMQGKETRRTALDAFHRALAGGDRFQGYLTNYRADGTKYRVELDCRPCQDPLGKVFAFIAFEREVTRRLGRPASGQAGRYEPADLSNDSFTGALRELGVFSAEYNVS
ncbi:PAS domain-containing protein (plasmid) [Methylobacterium sp. NMS14P]|uniref:PAS domain-containing protein n=1 Tax=Methylobacterium sp. NMS14P TaxID=2894310 RepID=UPI002358386B|nr:PAS domain-containing protein [Methylobacterium sp. NMS14P]WCS28851.1 PAS domain-containing protein [Methylobacterium sp. NMS14P]